jgi:orotidine-5'-phosphate decarboxylase
VEPLGDIGVVVGATVGDTGHDMRGLNGPVLVPGLGAQGGRPEDLRVVFGDDLSSVLPAYSRELLASGPSVGDLRAALDRLIDVCRKAVQPIG